MALNRRALRSFHSTPFLRSRTPETSIEFNVSLPQPKALNMVSTTYQNVSLNANFTSSITITNTGDACLTNVSASNLFSVAGKTKLLPIILILGPPGSGKGTLCKRLANEFNLYHLSVGDLLRASGQAPISGVSDRMNRYVSQNAPIPSNLIEAEFGTYDNAPAPLQLYQCTALNVSTPESLQLNAVGPLREECERISAQGKYRGIIVDNFQQSIGHCEAMAEAFGKGFPKLLIAVDCKDGTARARFISRARGSDSASRFDRRVAKFRRHYESIVQHIGASAPVVRVSTEAEPEEAYRQLLRGLGQCESWSDIRE